MKHIIGIRHEDKYVMERRVPVIPDHTGLLIREHGLEIQVEKSPKRVFTHCDYEKVGAKIVDNLRKASVIFGVKEIPEHYFEEGKTYIFFSHVVKGQSYNMPMLRKMIEKSVNLIDYEKIENDQGQRLIFFGRFAGLAGMINSLWSLGERFKELGIETPFLKIRQSHTYHSLDEARTIVSEVGRKITEVGLPAEISPLTIGFTGYGNVSQGAQEIAGLLPIREISPNELLDLRNRPDLPLNVLYKIVFKESDLSASVDSTEKFELQNYYTQPEKYKSIFEQYIPHLSVLMNCMYWDARYPRIVTKDYLEKLFKKGTPKLTVIGDITCDPDGSIECTHQGTEIENPVFVYNPFNRNPVMGFKGEGLLIMAVDILPSELPRESSIAFSNAMLRYIPAIASCDYTLPYDRLSLPLPVKKALILHQGKFTPAYQYLKKYI
ncbi:MAG: bifunctional lysine ketoglutarate reductase /saccharopine dehydrogenase family protein [Bacteroidales bacterium]